MQEYILTEATDRKDYFSLVILWYYVLQFQFLHQQISCKIQTKKLCSA